MAMDFSDEPGFPAAATSTKPDTIRLVTAPLFTAERLKERARQDRWRNGPNRARWLESQRRQNAKRKPR